MFRTAEAAESPFPTVAATRRLAAIMFTDLGSTALSQRDEASPLALVDEHRTRLRTVFARHHGREVKATGDGFLGEFPNALDAVR
jgi:adenylate cyclase